jgi:hypothetical protein
VKNLSQYTPVINAPVEFAGEIKVTQPAIASGSAVSGVTVNFAGGAFGDNIATNTLMFFSGRYTMHNTPETTWSAGFDNDSSRQHVMPGSSLSVDHVYRTHSLNILSGGAVTANVVNVAVAANGQRVWAWNAGEYVVTGAVVATSIANNLEMTTGWANNSVGKFEKITIDGSAADKYFNFGNASTAASHTFYIGEGGLNFNTPETLASYSAGYALDGDVVTFKPWHGSFAIGQAGDAGKFRMYAATVFDTDNEAGEGKTITVNCGTTQKIGEGKSITVKGSGTLRLNGAVIGSIVLHVVVPDTLYFTGSNLNAYFGEATPLPLAALYQRRPVAIAPADVRFEVSTSDEGIPGGEVHDFAFTGQEESGLKTVLVTASLGARPNIRDTVTVTMYNRGDVVFDFDQATGGDRSLAWLRRVSNAVSEDGSTYRVVDPAAPMVTDYTFAIDMSAIAVPEQLKELTNMLPGADQTDGTAWGFLLQLADRISVLSQVRAAIQIDPNF